MKQKISIFFGTLCRWFAKKKILTKVVIVFFTLWLFQMSFSLAYITLGCGKAERFATDSKAQIPESFKEKYKVRNEESSYLTFPEWYIVYSGEELAEFDKHNEPSTFSYFSATRQFWESYCEVTRVTKANYGFNFGDHVMLFVIGESFTIENTLKGVYENAIGRIFELFGESQEDHYAQKVNEDYANFLHTVPWYEYPFHKKLAGLWTETDLLGRNFLRKWERKTVLTIEYAVKSGYGSIIKIATKSLYGDADLETHAITESLPEGLVQRENRIKVMGEENGASLVTLPRYQAFTDIVAKENIPFLEIAGNNEIAISVIAPSDAAERSGAFTVIYAMEVLTKPGLSRLLLKVDVEALRSVVSDLEKHNMRLEHIYDY